MNERQARGAGKELAAVTVGSTSPGASLEKKGAGLDDRGASWVVLRFYGAPVATLLPDTFGQMFCPC